MNIVLIVKSNKPTASEAIKYLQKSFNNIHLVDVSKKKPNLKKLSKINPDYLISYISDCIIPSPILTNTKNYNINFHPGPPEYPGFGCYNFALYQESKTYGCTCHIMEKIPDTGRIIDVKKFRVNKTETVLSLSNKTYKNMLTQFKDIIDKLKNNQKIKFSNNQWLRHPYKKLDLDKLCQINLSMSDKEVAKRIRATFYPGKPNAYINFKGYNFEYKSKNEK